METDELIPVSVPDGTVSGEEGVMLHPAMQGIRRPVMMKMTDLFTADTSLLCYYITNRTDIKITEF